MRTQALTRVEQMTQGQSDRVREFWVRLLLRVSPTVQQRIEEDATRALGFVHVWSASGIHLWALALSVSATVMHLLQRWSIHAALWGRVGGLLVCAWAWILADCAAGMLRPLLVILLRSWSNALGLKWRMWSPLILSLVIEAAVSATGSSGRWHYAAAVGFGLMGLEAARSAKPGRLATLRAHAAMALASWLPIALFEAFSQGWTSVLTPVWSLITLPILAQLAYPLAFVGIFLPPMPALSWALGCIHQILHWCFEASLLLPTIWHFGPIQALGGIALGCLSLTFKSSLPVRTQARVIAAACAFAVTRIAIQESAPSAPAIAAQKIQQLAVGQGDAALIQWDERRSILLDTGPPGGLLLSRLLSAWKPGAPSRLETLALSHLDLDHRGGVPALARWVDWNCLLTPSTFDETRPDGGCPAPGVWAVIHPDIPRVRDRNQEMLGAWIPLPGAEYLNLGDADVRGEQRLWSQLKLNKDQYYQILKTNTAPQRILKVSHHGSKTSSGAGLLGSYAPQTAWISAGRRNSFGHPHPKVLQRLKGAGIQVLSTQTNPTLAISD